MTAWVIRFEISRDRAPDIEAALETLDPVPSISAFAPEEGDPVFKVEAYFPDEPDQDQLKAVLGDLEHTAEPLPDVDWVSHSQSLLPPITAGRFHVYGAHVADTLKPGQLGLWIEANQAFGTGRHETTFGCLLAVDWLTRRRRIHHALDLGCGSGVLGFGLRKAQPACVMMSDIDPVSVEVAKENARRNGIVPQNQARRGAGVQLIAAQGIMDRRIQAAGPYDLILANILARPLQLLAEDVTGAVKPSGHIVLAGLLNSQAAAVLSRYRVHGWTLRKRIDCNEWPTLILARRT